MNKIEAQRILHAQLLPWRERSYRELRGAVGQSRRFEATGESGRSYQGDVQVVWDDKPDGAIRVMASIDDGGPELSVGRGRRQPAEGHDRLEVGRHQS
jgi:hypothetical protein